MRLVEEAVPRRVEVPVLEMLKRVEVAVPPVVEAMAKSVDGEPIPFVEVAVTESNAHGVVEPTASLPATKAPFASDGTWVPFQPLVFTLTIPVASLVSEVSIVPFAADDPDHAKAPILRLMKPGMATFAI